MYYAFYAAEWKGPLSLHGLGKGTYSVHDLFNEKDLGTVDARANTLETQFRNFLLLRATPSSA